MSKIASPRRTLLLALASLAATSLACSSSSSDGANGVTCAQVVADRCARDVECEPVFVPYSYGTLEACITRGAVVCDPLVAAPGSGMTADALSACDAKLKGATCDDVIRGATSCEIKGTRDDGKPCGSDTQCTSGFCKHGSGNDLCGVCGEAPAEGEPCDPSGRCGAGFTCSAAASGSCVAIVGIGATCDATHVCGSGLCVSGTCAHAAQLGEACSVDGSTGPVCDFYQSLDCDPSTSKCVTVAFEGLGGACNLGAHPVKPCLGGTFCKGETATADGVCTDDLADGASCSDTVGDAPCLPPAVCANSVCTVFDPAFCK